MRTYPLVSPLNEDQIFIAGGYRDGELSDAIILDAEQMTTSAVFSKGDFAFVCQGG